MRPGQGQYPQCRQPLCALCQTHPSRGPCRIACPIPFCAAVLLATLATQHASLSCLVLQMPSQAPREGLTAAAAAAVEPAAAGPDPFAMASHFRLRWFTPTCEVPCCGHATVASAAVLYQGAAGRLVTVLLLHG